MLSESPRSRTPIRSSVGRSALLVLEDHWLCALLRASLLEGRHGAACAPTLRLGLVRERELAGVVLVDQRALARGDSVVLEALAAFKPPVPAILLAGRLAPPAPGPWVAILRRPIAAGDVARTIARALDGHFASSRRSATPATTGLEQRFEPWPAIACHACGITRHYESTHEERRLERTRADMARFALEHVECAGRRAS